MNKPKYLVRPSDFHIFEIDESNGAYRPRDSRDMYNRPPAYEHFNLSNLVHNFGFFAIEEHEIVHFERMSNLRSTFQSWQQRPDGHGGVKGGTWEEFFNYNGTFEEAMEIIAHNGAKTIAKEEDEEILRKLTQELDIDHHKTKLI